jgi:hypothetical protein
MEKKWICYLGLFALTYLGFLVPIQAKAKVQPVEVEVEVPIKGRNVAQALEDSQKEAFKQAIEQLLDPEMEEASKAKILNKASTYIKSFRVLNRRERGNKLFIRYRCDVVTSFLEQTQENKANVVSSGYFVEVRWNPLKESIDAMDLVNFMKKDLRMKVKSFKLSRGSFVVGIPASKTPSQVRSDLSRHLQGKAEVSILEPELYENNFNTFNGQ